MISQSTLLNDPSSGLGTYAIDLAKNPAAKGLALNARVLVPVQRLMRYKMLIDEILKNIVGPARGSAWDQEKTALKKTLHKFAKANLKCNDRMGQIEDWEKLRALQEGLL